MTEEVGQRTAREPIKSPREREIERHVVARADEATTAGLRCEPRVDAVARGRRLETVAAQRLVAALVGAQLGVRAVSEVGAGEGADLEEAFAALTKGGDA